MPDATPTSSLVDLTDLARDVSRGKEPVPIPVVGLSLIQLESLAKLVYVADSIGDGQPISQLSTAANAQPEVEEDEDEEQGNEASRGSSSSFSEFDEEDLWGCDCVNAGEGVCKRSDGDDCDCVSSFGNFYSDPVEASTGRSAQTLNLGALPARLPLVECSTACNCGSACANRVTQSGIQIPLTVLSRPTGLGLSYTPQTHKSALPQGTFICLYAGEYLSTDQARERWRSQSNTKQEEGQGNYILSLRLPDDIIHIDPRHIGNAGRFLNHSCDPNCVIHVVRWGPESLSRAAIVTKRDVEAGEELTFDYGNASGSEAPSSSHVEAQASDDSAAAAAAESSGGRTRCLCRATKCRGWMPYDPSL